MPTPRETILQALLAALQTAPGATALRGAILPERIPPGGLLNLRDGDPGTPEVTLSPLRYHYEHRTEVEVIVQGKTPAARDVAFDALLAELATATTADRTLGGRSYEPFSGSGLQIIAGEANGQRVFAMEIGRPYVDVAMEHWQA